MTYLKIQARKKSAKWFSEIKNSFAKADVSVYGLPETLLAGKVTIAAYGSVAGVQLEVKEDILYLYDLNYASSIDKKMYLSLVQNFRNGEFSFVRSEDHFDLVEFLDSESYLSDDEDAVFRRRNKSLSLFSLKAAAVGKNDASRERFFIETMDNLEKAKEVELYPVDGLQSFIWDGELTWVPAELQQVLFSQKAFKGKLCGLASIDDFSKVLGNRVIRDDVGILIPSVEVLGASDFKALNVQMEQFETKPKKAKPEALTIAVGKLEEISYSMTRSIFDGQSLKSYSDQLIQEGFGQGQIEVAALAVSGMLEIAATSQGASLQEMTSRLKEKNTLSEDAALAVASGFVKAAQEEPAARKKAFGKKLFIGLAVLALGGWLLSYL